MHGILPADFFQCGLKSLRPGQRLGLLLFLFHPALTQRKPGRVQHPGRQIPLIALHADAIDFGAVPKGRKNLMDPVEALPVRISMLQAKLIIKKYAVRRRPQQEGPVLGAGGIFRQLPVDIRFDFIQVVPVPGVGLSRNAC